MLPSVWLCWTKLSPSSGFGRVRGVVGLREMVQPRVIPTRKAGGFRPYLFPYGDLMPRILSAYRRIFHARG